MFRRLTVGSLALMSLAGCETMERGSPLIFARTQTYGVSIAGSVPDQGAQLTMGYGDRNLAIVPTTQSNGETIRGTGQGSDFQDALSVLGQFEATGKGSDVSATLGTFFSTGNASRLLAQGFSCKLGPTQDACGNAATTAVTASSSNVPPAAASGSQ